MHHHWTTLISASILMIAMTFIVPSHAEAAKKNVLKAHLIPVLGSDGRQPMVTFGSGTIRIKREGVRVTLELDEISTPDGTSGELQLTLKINGNRELVILPFDITAGPGEMGTVTLDASLLEIVDVVRPGDTVEIRRARITIAGELVGTIGFLAEEETAFEGLASVIDSLRAQGHDVDVGDEILQSFFSVPGQTIILDEQSVQVFEYDNAAAAETEAGFVSPDGFFIDTGEVAVAVDWTATPHFHTRENVIVLYVGDRTAILGALTGLLGAQFAGGEDPNIGMAVVEAIKILILESFPVQVQVIARGQLPDGCTKIGQINQQRNGTTFVVTITTSRPVQAFCTLALVPFEEVIVLDVLGLAAGVYTVEVNDVSDSFSLAVDNVPFEMVR